MMTYIGHHIIAELKFTDGNSIKRVGQLKQIFEDAVKKSRLTKLSSDYHQFKPFGVTGYILLAESHVSFHTWPENNYMSIDVFSCGSKEQAEIVFNYLLEKLKPITVNKKDFSRGI